MVKVYVLKTPNMKLPYDMTTFLQNGKNKELLFNLIERSIVEDKKKLNERVAFFSNMEHCLKISSDQVLQIPEKASDHEEADTKLVALVESNKNMLIKKGFDIILMRLNEQSLIKL